jgi:cytochrome c-type biogenesis protein CcmH/NrfG
MPQDRTPKIEVVSTSRGRVATVPVSEEYDRLRRKRSKRALIAGTVAALVFAGAGAWGLIHAQDSPDSPYNQPKQQQQQDPFGF